MVRGEGSLGGLEDIIASKGRLKILRLLAENGEMNISEITRRASLAYMAANQHLKALKRSGLVEEKCFYRVRIFRFREEDARCQLLKRFFEDCRALDTERLPG